MASPDVQQKRCPEDPDPQRRPPEEELDDDSVDSVDEDLIADHAKHLHDFMPSFDVMHV